MKVSLVCLGTAVLTDGQQGPLRKLLAYWIAMCEGVWALLVHSANADKYPKPLGLSSISEPTFRVIWVSVIIQPVFDLQA